MKERFSGVNANASQGGNPSSHELLADRIHIQSTNLVTKQQKEQILRSLKAGESYEEPKPSPNATSLVYSSEEANRVNFQKWVLILVSFASTVLTATLIYLGLSSSGIMEHSMYAGKVLVLLGSLACIVNILTIFATFANKNRTLLFIVYIDFMLIAYLLIYSLGCITFQPNMQQWVYLNWEEIGSKLQKTDLIQFQKDVVNQIISLGVTALTLSIGFAISIFFIVLRLHLKRILLTFVPAFAIMFIVFGSSILWLAIYILVRLSFVNIPFWMSIVSLCLGGALTLIGIVGYVASLKEMRRLTVFYLVFACLTCLAILVCCIAYFLLSGNVDFYLDQYWPQVRQELDRANIWIPRSTFSSGLILNIKFSGLYGITFFFFLSFGLAASIYQVTSIS